MPDSFSPTIGTFITLSDAQTMVSNWISLQNTMSITIDEANPKAHAFGIDKFQDIIDQSGCVGLRIYNGYSDSKRRLVVIGVDENSDDMTSGYILDLARPCPPNCPSTPLA